MSANNYAICPRCLATERQRLADLHERIRDGYGKLPLEQFEALRAEADQGIDEEKLRTFREDYEFYGASEGVVTASYGGHCSKCGLDLQFQDEHPIPGLTP